MKAITRILRRWITAWVGLISLLALGMLVLALVRQPRGTITFEVVDYVTGNRIPGVKVEVLRTWTRLPVEKLPVLRMDRTYTEVIPAKSGIVRLSGLPNFESVCRVVVRAAGYADAFIQQQPTPAPNGDIGWITYFPSGGSNWLHESSYEYVKGSKPFTVALEPDIGGVQRAGARYPLAPSLGSKDKAITALKRYAEKRGGKVNKVESVEFFNGHWEVRVPSTIGSGTQYDVSEDGVIFRDPPGRMSGASD